MASAFNSSAEWCDRKLPFFFRTSSPTITQRDRGRRSSCAQGAMPVEGTLTCNTASTQSCIATTSAKVGNECNVPNAMSIACTSYYAFTQLIVLLYHFNFMQHNYHFSHSFARGRQLSRGIFSIAARSVRTEFMRARSHRCRSLVSQIVWTWMARSLRVPVPSRCVCVTCEACELTFG